MLFLIFEILLSEFHIFLKKIFRKFLFHQLIVAYGEIKKLIYLEHE